jgi:two-component system, OmpR family, KDP operon response regulator KdpE
VRARRVLICDDEPQILHALTLILSEAGFEAVPSATAREALDRVALRPPEAAIIDLLLPDGDGVQLCRHLREWSRMPILVLSAVNEESEKVRALAAGADDFITKPFGAGELVARLEAGLRRAGSSSDEAVVRADGLEIDFRARLVRAGSREVRVTPIEYDLLRVLVQNRGKVMTHRALLSEVWGPGYATDTHVLRFHVSNLRRKISATGRAGSLIRTEPGIGYRFVPSTETEVAGGDAVSRT